MSFKTKSMVIVFAAELGVSCLLSGGIIWGIWNNRASTAYAQPIATQQPIVAELSITPFIKHPITATIPAFKVSGLEIVLSTPTVPGFEAISTPEIISSPANIALPINNTLTTQQQLWLGIVSMRYIAPTTADGIRLAKELNYIGKDGHPSNICGPLSIAILREAGVISSDTSLDKFWLLDPKQPVARQLLARTFPAERFEDLRFTTPLNKFDWEAFPLLPGDFLYLYAGTGGNFEHMLVVNRVDSQKRAYAVTNYGTPEGFVITEVMLYDPKDKNIGIFHTWTKQNYAMLGSTGFGGFEVWRLRSP
jgi:hypothetical protein